jgi:MOSC domain-containing protein YiiM
MSCFVLSVSRRFTSITPLRPRWVFCAYSRAYEWKRKRTPAGLDENSVNNGDRYRVGSAVVQVTQRRLPCFKLVAKFQCDDILKRFLKSGRTGFYFAVLEEGTVGMNDEIELLSRDESNVTVATVVRLYLRQEEDAALLAKLTRLAALPGDWREHFQRQLTARSEAQP